MKVMILIAMSIFSLEAHAQSCNKVVVKANSVYFPANLGKEKICELNVSWVETAFGHYSELGITNSSIATAYERVGSLSCSNGKKFALINVNVTDSSNQQSFMVYAVSVSDLME